MVHREKSRSESRTENKEGISEETVVPTIFGVISEEIVVEVEADQDEKFLHFLAL